jgi:hypothetical protein
LKSPVDQLLKQIRWGDAEQKCGMDVADPAYIVPHTTNSPSGNVVMSFNCSFTKGVATGQAVRSDGIDEDVRGCKQGRPALDDAP